MRIFATIPIILSILTSPSLAESLHLSSVRHFMYQLQKLNEDGAIQSLARSNYDMLILEPGHNFSEYPYDTATMVRALRNKPDGSRRILLAYIDIGQAEDYRRYWKEDWVAPSNGQPGFPDFLVTLDPDGWSGNYPVAFWHKDWKDLWLSNKGIVATLARFGFDGIYLDWVEAYDDEEVMARAKTEGVKADMEMIAFVEELGQSGQAVRPGFLVVAQNAPYLLDTDPKRYLAAIDALAVEDTWFHGYGDSDWDDPDGGDQQDRHDGDYATSARLEQIRRYQKSGLPIFSIDYALQPENVAHAYDQAIKAGFIPLVTRVALSKMTETRPPALSE